jgi:hypothetical protein
MTGIDRADQSRHSRLGALLSQGGCEAALPPARWVDRAPPRLIPGQTLAEPDVAHISDPSADWRVWLGATDAPDSRSCPPMTPRWSSRGKRLAGTLHEPFERADGGRAPQPDLLRLYTVDQRDHSTRWEGRTSAATKLSEGVSDEAGPEGPTTSVRPITTTAAQALPGGQEEQESPSPCARRPQFPA